MPKFIDLSNRQFGRWTVIKPAENIGIFTAWLCFCDCGTTRVVRGQDLRREKSISCGCLKNEKLIERSRKHNGKGTRLYRIWKGMRNRCNNPSLANYSNYNNYGKRGISVCKEWDEFSIFKTWALENGYSDNLTIDRINNDGNYEPSNCRWVTRATQTFNTRANRIVETCLGDLPITKLARLMNIDRHVLARRLNNGLNEDELLKPTAKLRRYS